MTTTLVADIGNTHFKLAIDYQQEIKLKVNHLTQHLKNRSVLETYLNSFLEEVKSKAFYPEKYVICSVVPDLTKEAASLLDKKGKQKVTIITSNLTLPFKLKYKTPHTLGADRLAVASFARTKFKKSAIIAIDFGTAITYDVITSKHIYLGGFILCGFGAALTCLHQQTAQLPQVQFKKQSLFIGTSTIECLERGAYWGAVEQTNALIKKLKKELKEKFQDKSVKVVATGGDASVLAKHIKFDCIEPDAVIKGGALLGGLNQD